MLDPEHASALRLFNGWLEGFPRLIVEVFGRTLVIFDHSRHPEIEEQLSTPVWQFLKGMLPWLETCVLKTHFSQDPRKRRGILVTGDHPCDRIEENNTWYALDLLLNQDASFYLDTRNLRKWLKEHAKGWQVLNTFAYTGTLGIAALAGNAAQVVQADVSRKFLDLAKRSYALNGWSLQTQEFLAEDYFSTTSRFRHTARTFDCAIIDPPFFSITSKGRVDQVTQSNKLINKIRPLVKEGGWLIVINNALFVSGEEYLQTLKNICKDGYILVDQLMDVPPDVAGFPNTITGKSPAVTDPFNHSTKIALLRVLKRK